jgi:hypothetical protein
MSIQDAVPKEAESDHAQRAYEIVCDVIRRRREGELILDDAVLDDHPELADHLVKLLRQARLVDQMAQIASGEKWTEAFRRMKADDEGDPQPDPERQRAGTAAAEDSKRQSPDQSDAPEPSQDIEVADSISIGRGSSWFGAPSEPAKQGQRKTSAYTSLGEVRERSTEKQARRFRPLHRPPMALLEVYDDDQQNFELIRIRAASFSIGREEGDLVIPHESQMSRRHVCIERRRDSDTYRWYLRDLGSRNGTYIRAARVALKHEDELLLGGVLIRFIQAAGPESASLAKITPRGYEEQVKLRPRECWLGTDPRRCLDFLTNNPYLDPHHIRFDVGNDGRWRISDEQSTNGVFVRVKHIEIREGAEFLAGEQRFCFRQP